MQLGIGVHQEAGVEQMKIKWKHEYQIIEGESAYIGRWKVGSVFYDGMVSAGQEFRWVAICTLPGIQIKHTHYETRSEVKALLTKVVKYWFKQSGMLLPLKRRKRVIGIIGTRRRDSDYDLRLVENEFLRHYHKGDTICSGLCPKGGDRFAVILHKKYNTPCIWHKAEWERLGKYAGFSRNGLIAEDSDVLICCVANDRKGGTEDTLRKFKKLGKKNWYAI